VDGIGRSLEFAQEGKIGCMESMSEMLDDLTCVAGDFDLESDDPGLPFDFEGGRHVASEFDSDARPLDLFRPGDEAPHLPSSPHFELEPTTVSAQSSECHRLGNALQHFFYDKFSAAPTKVDRDKFTIRAEISCGIVACVVKLRVHQHELTCDRLSVELQRRSGDAVFFVHIFRKLVEYLKENDFFASDVHRH